MNKRCLFVLPRFHTNIAAAVNRLVFEGWKVRLFVGCSYSGEDHSFVTPELIHDIKNVEKEILEFNPGISFVRFIQGVSPNIMQFLVRNNFLVYAYCQYPASLEPSKPLLERYTSGFPEVTRISPVRGFPTNLALKRSIYLPLPVNIEDYSQPNSIFKPIKIVLVGKLNHKRKNQLNAIKFLDTIPFKSGYSLTLVGNEAKNNGDPCAEHYNLLKYIQSKRNNIEILEDIPHSKMKDIYSANDFCILPSFNEPLGTSPLEAMGTGCIPIISNQCGSCFEIKNEKNGIIFDPLDFSSLHAPLTKIINNNYLLNKIAINAYEYAATSLSPKRFCSTVGKLCHDLRDS